MRCSALAAEALRRRGLGFNLFHFIGFLYFLSQRRELIEEHLSERIHFVESVDYLFTHFIIS
jgi:hypothetical protein